MKEFIGFMVGFIVGCIMTHMALSERMETIKTHKDFIEDKLRWCVCRG